jgi:hypothetical protein
LAIRYWTRGAGYWEDFTQSNPIAKGAAFQIVINVQLAGYTIGIDGKPTIQIQFDYDKMNDEPLILPPWSADHIFVSKMQQSAKKLLFK